MEKIASIQKTSEVFHIQTLSVKATKEQVGHIRKYLHKLAIKLLPEL